MGAISPLDKAGRNAWETFQGLFGDLKNFHEKQPVYRHSMLATLLLSCSLRSNKGITLSVTGVQTNKGARAFCSCASFLWNNLLLSVHSVIWIATFKKCFTRHLFDLSCLPLTPVRLIARWCYGNASSILLSKHWFSCCSTQPGYLRGYWHYNNFIDWLIFDNQTAWHIFNAWFCGYIHSRVLLQKNC